MRRFNRILVSVAMGLLALAGVAWASSQFTQTANITLTATKAGKPTGFKALLQSADPGETQPQGLKTLTITFPAGTKFNFKSKALKQCTASDTTIKAIGCPSKSRIGNGSAVANGAPVIPSISENAAAFAGRGQIIFLFTPKGLAGQVLVLHGTVSGNKLTTSVPVINVGGLNIVITALTLNIKTIGTGSQAFVTAGKCAAGKFTVTSNFVYQTGAALTLSSSSPCSK